MQLNDGDQFTYVSSWTPSTDMIGVGVTPDTMIGEISADVASQGLTVLKSSYNQSASAYLNAATLGTFTPEPFTVTLTVEVTNGVGFASQDDAASIINNAVYQRSNVLPVSSVPYVNSSTATGEPTTPGASSTAASGVTGFLSSLTTQGMWTLGAVAVAIVLGLVLINGAERKLA